MCKILLKTKISYKNAKKGAVSSGYTVFEILTICSTKKVKSKHVLCFFLKVEVYKILEHLLCESADEPRSFQPDGLDQQASLSLNTKDFLHVSWPKIP